MSRQCIAGNGESEWPPSWIFWIFCFLSLQRCPGNVLRVMVRSADHHWAKSAACLTEQIWETNIHRDDEVWGKGWDNATPKITEITKTTNKCSFWLHDTPPHSFLPFYKTPWHVCHSIEKGRNLKLQKIRLQQSCGLLIIMPNPGAAPRWIRRTFLHFPKHLLPLMVIPIPMWNNLMHQTPSLI